MLTAPVSAADGSPLAEHIALSQGDVGCVPAADVSGGHTLLLTCDGALDARMPMHLHVGEGLLTAGNDLPVPPVALDFQVDAAGEFAFPVRGVPPIPSALCPDPPHHCE